MTAVHPGWVRPSTSRPTTETDALDRVDASADRALATLNALEPAQALCAQVRQLADRYPDHEEYQDAHAAARRLLALLVRCQLRANGQLLGDRDELRGLAAAQDDGQ